MTNITKYHTSIIYQIKSILTKKTSIIYTVATVSNVAESGRTRCQVVRTSVVIVAV